MRHQLTRTKTGYRNGADQDEVAHNRGVSKVSLKKRTYCSNMIFFVSAILENKEEILLKEEDSQPSHNDPQLLHRIGGNRKH